MAEDQFNDLYEKLKTLDTWPHVYMFKFIVPSDNNRIARVQGLFDESAEIQTKESSAGKYTSITIRQVMLSPEMVIAIYREAAQIEGVMSL